MVVRVLLMMLLALGLAGFGVTAWIAVHPPANAPHPAALRSLLAAAAMVPAGTLLQPADFETVTVPADQAAADAETDNGANRAALLGAMVRRTLPAHSVIGAGDVVRPGDHGFLAAVLEPGMRAVSVGVNQVSGTAGLIWPGDHVDLLLTQLTTDQDVPRGERVSGEDVLQDARVIAIDQQLIQGGAQSAATVSTNRDQQRTVTLEVTPDQASRIAVATRLGELSLAVRPADQTVLAAPAAPTPAVIWGYDVSTALRAPKPAPGAHVAATMHVYEGATDPKDVQF